MALREFLIGLRTSLLLAFFLSPSVFAQPIRFNLLSAEEHALHDFVITSLERVSDDFLWIGTTAGPNRFEGLSARRFDWLTDLPQEYTRWIVSIEPDPRATGSIWMATKWGHILHYDSPTQQLSLAASSQLQSQFSDLAWGNGSLWISSLGDGLLQLDPETRVLRRVTASPDLPDSIRVVQGSTSRPGTLWLGSTAGLIEFVPGEETAARLDLEGHPGITTLEERGGVIWAGTSAGFVYSLDLAADSVTTIPISFLSSISALSHSSARPGTVWIGTRGFGLFEYRIADQSLTRVEGLMPGGEPFRATDITALKEDEQGILWVGTATGLYRGALNARRFPEPIQLPGGISPLSLYRAPSEPHVVWAGTIRNGLFRIASGQAALVPGSQSGPHALVFTMLEDSKGRFWFGSEGLSLYLLDRDSYGLTSFPLGHIDNSLIHGIREDEQRPGILWVATKGAGLIEFNADTGQVLRSFNATSTAGEFPEDDVYAVAQVQSAPTYLWVPTFNTGLWQLDSATGNLVQVPLDSCPSVSILAVYDSGDALWAGTYMDGLLRLDPESGDCRRFTKADGLTDFDVGAILPDSQDRLWLTTSAGISVLDPETEIVTGLGKRDGLQGDVFYYPAAHRGQDGLMVFGGASGLNIIDPDVWQSDDTHARVVITEVLVDGVRQANPAASLRLDTNQNDVAFAFATLDFTRPERVRYRIRDKPESAWREIGEDTEERFPSLGSGRYLFEVQATNGDGYWGAESAQLEVVVLPPFWLRWYVLLGAAFVLLTLVAGSYHYRLLQISRLERTRRRIADDLHDDIGSKLSAVTLGLDLATHQWALGDGERAQLQGLTKSAREVVGDLKDSVWIVDGGHDSLANTIERMEEFAHQALKAHQYSFIAPELAPTAVLSMEQRRHLFLLYKEALNNVIRHASATEVTVTVSFRARSLELEVTDDGIGMPTAGSSGRGLSTMRRRAEALGATLTISPRPVRGTRVRLQLDLG